MKDLLCAAQPVVSYGGIQESLDMAAKLEKLGMTKLAGKALEEHNAREKIDILAYLKEYPRITEKMIEVYCKNESRKREWKINNGRTLADVWRTTSYGNRSYTYVTVSWKETDLEEYDKYPPMDVLEKLETAKSLDLFDKFVIATLDEKREVHTLPLKDPLLLGVINGSSDRYVIAQWDDDIDLDTLLNCGSSLPQAKSK